MGDDKIWGQVAAVFGDVMGVDAETFSPATTAEDVETWDSVNHVRLIMALEAAFGIRFSNKEIGGFERLGDISATLAEKTAA